MLTKNLAIMVKKLCFLDNVQGCGCVLFLNPGIWESIVCEIQTIRYGCKPLQKR